MILSQYSLKLWNDICHFTLDEFYLDSGHKETPLWSPCMQIRSPGPVIAKCEKVNRTFGPAVQKFCRTGQDLTGPKIFFFSKSKELYSHSVFWHNTWLNNIYCHDSRHLPTPFIPQSMHGPTGIGNAGDPHCSYYLWV